MEKPKSLKAVCLDFFNRDGAYWVRVTLVTDGEETVMETECDASRIRFNLDSPSQDKSEWN